MREMTPAEADALARLLVVVRPDWSLEFAIPAVRKMRLIDSSLERIVRVAINGALLKRNGGYLLRKPDVLAMTGEHWRAVHDRDDSEPSRAELCPRCNDWHMPHVDCQAEGWVKKPTRKAEQYHAHAGEALALVREVVATHCSHGVPLALCVEHTKAVAGSRRAEDTEDQEASNG